MASHKPWIEFFENIDTFERTRVLKVGIDEGFEAIAWNNEDS